MNFPCTSILLGQLVYLTNISGEAVVHEIEPPLYPARARLLAASAQENGHCRQCMCRLDEAILSDILSLTRKRNHGSNSTRRFREIGKAQGSYELRPL